MKALFFGFVFFGLLFNHLSWAGFRDPKVIELYRDFSAAKKITEQDPILNGYYKCINSLAYGKESLNRSGIIYFENKDGSLKLRYDQSHPELSTTINQAFTLLPGIEIQVRKKNNRTLIFAISWKSQNFDKMDITQFYSSALGNGHGIIALSQCSIPKQETLTQEDLPREGSWPLSFFYPAYLESLLPQIPKAYSNLSQKRLISDLNTKKDQIVSIFKECVSTLQTYYIFELIGKLKQSGEQAGKTLSNLINEYNSFLTIFPEPVRRAYELELSIPAGLKIGEKRTLNLSSDEESSSSDNQLTSVNEHSAASQSQKSESRRHPIGKLVQRKWYKLSNGSWATQFTEEGDTGTSARYRATALRDLDPNIGASSYDTTRTLTVDNPDLLNQYLNKYGYASIHADEASADFENLLKNKRKRKVITQENLPLPTQENLPFTKRGKQLTAGQFEAIKDLARRVWFKLANGTWAMQFSDPTDCLSHSATRAVILRNLDPEIGAKESTHFNILKVTNLTVFNQLLEKFNLKPIHPEMATAEFEEKVRTKRSQKSLFDFDLYFRHPSYPGMALIRIGEFPRSWQKAMWRLSAFCSTESSELSQFKWRIAAGWLVIDDYGAYHDALTAFVNSKVLKEVERLLPDDDLELNLLPENLVSDSSIINLLQSVGKSEPSIPDVLQTSVPAEMSEISFLFDENQSDLFKDLFQDFDPDTSIPSLD